MIGDKVINWCNPETQIWPMSLTSNVRQLGQVTVVIPQEDLTDLLLKALIKLGVVTGEHTITASLAGNSYTGVKIEVVVLEDIDDSNQG